MISKQDIKRLYVKIKNSTTLPLALMILAAVTFVLPRLVYNPVRSIENEVAALEKSLIKREKLLGEYVRKAFDTPNDQWFDTDLPDDMVIYKYVDDTLQSWAHELPISNDEIESYRRWTRDSSSLVYSGQEEYPLASIGIRGEYKNLGSGWYLIKAYKKDKTKIIAAILIKTEYGNQNNVIHDYYNEHLKITKYMDILPIGMDYGHEISDQSGHPCFTVVYDIHYKRADETAMIYWLTLLLVTAALFILHARQRTIRSHIVFLAGIILLRLISGNLIEAQSSDYLIFSPNLYADNHVFNSLGSLLLNHLFVFLVIASIYVLRKKMVHAMPSMDKRRKNLLMASLSGTALALAAYIHISLVSLVRNSGIVLELFRLPETDVYTILCYAAYGLLYIALFLIIQMILAGFYAKRKRLLRGLRPNIIYLLAVSLHMLITISVINFQKEEDRNSVWANKLSAERDLNLELQLSLLEYRINSDPTLRYLASMQPWNSNAIRARIIGVYFPNASKKYDFRITVCRDISCIEHFNNEIMRYGIPFSTNSNIFFLNNFNGRASYIMVVPFISPDSNATVFIEIESRIANDTMGYPAFLIDSNQFDNINMPGNYSYAKYLQGRLTFNKGRYNFPMNISMDAFEEGYSVTRHDKRIFYANKISPDNLVVITRPETKLYQYLVFLSYILLFFGSMFYIIFKLRKSIFKIHIYRNSFKRKISLLLTGSFATTLVAMIIGVTVFILNIYKEMNFLGMNEKLRTARTSLQNTCKYINSYTDIDPEMFYGALNILSENMGVDINAFDPQGRLSMSTQPEIFESMLKSSRMNSDAYYNLMFKKYKEYSHPEKIDDFEYYSLYTPIYNESGNLITIINIPYFSNSSTLNKEAAYILTAITNLLLLLMLAATFGASTISNSITKPLVEISRKIKYLDISRKLEHINYKKNDELGDLVKAYNNMVDHLEKSTRQLAQSEREMAWKEMARQIAHEIKNPLTPMKLSIQYLIRLKSQNIPNWEEKFDSLAVSLIEQIDILTDVASEFSSFARFYTEDATTVDLGILLDEQKVLFDNKENLQLELRKEVENATVTIRKGQITRVFVNLITNAIQALEGYVKGYVRITLRKDGDYYAIDFEDNGGGVPDEFIENLFKPNFTTKSSGTGLGLSICSNIMKQSQGEISYKRSNDLGGADFTIRIPING